MINLHVELIRGFRQSDEFPTGVESLREDLREFESSTVEVKLSRWDENWKGRARQIDQSCSQDARIIVVAYSWGVGYGARTLAHYLDSLRPRRRIDRLFSIDGVYHSRWMPWRAVWGPLSEKIFGEPVIRLPSNVAAVDAWYQVLNWPSGHEIAVEGKGPVRRKLLGRTHENIDEAPEIHKAVYECVKLHAMGS